jgi:nucleoside-triphosphatase THEP1
MRKLICLFGISNVGKSTIANQLAEEINGYHVTAIDKWKRFLEEVYQLPFKSLNTQEGKQAEVGNTTVGKILEDSYHFWAERDPQFGSNCLEATLNELSQVFNYPDLVVESIRFPAEVERIKKYAQENGYTLIGFHVKSTKRGKVKSTDKLVGACLTRFPRSAPLITIDNDDQPVCDTISDVVEWVEAFHGIPYDS